MEQARRLADSPLDRIKQAAKFRRKANVDPPRADPEPDPPALPVAAPVAPPVERLLALPQRFAVPLPSPAPALGSVGPAERITLASSVAAPSPAVAALLAPPRLIHRVEPSVSSRALDSLRRTVEVWVELNILADGSVANVGLEPGTPYDLQRPITDALSQWRYAPLPAPRTQRVRIVFNPA